MRPLALSPFAREFTYTIYGANASIKVLRLNLLSKRYEILDALGFSTSGSLTEDAAEPGAYLFGSSRLTSSTTSARVRIQGDLVVGAFPFESAWSESVPFELVPFVGGREFVSSRLPPDGTYNRIELNHKRTDRVWVPGRQGTSIGRMRIDGGGTKLHVCQQPSDSMTIDCAAGVERLYTISPSPDGNWTATGATGQTSFRIARINGENVFLSVSNDGENKSLTVALVDETLSRETVQADGVATGAVATRVFLDGAQYGVRHTDAGGRIGGFSYSHALVPGTRGLRLANGAGSERFYLAHNGSLLVAAGYPLATNTTNYLLFGAVRQESLPSDPRSSEYVGFAVHDGEHTLSLNFGLGTFGFTGSGGQSTGGTFSALDSEKGTFVFTTPRVTSAVNTARFRLSADLVVGSFPFTLNTSAPPGGAIEIPYVVQPFLASRAIVQSQSELDGLYNRLNLASDEQWASALPLQQMRISGGGTQMEVCTESGLSFRFDLASCAPEARSAYTITPGDKPGQWHFATSAPPGHGDRDYNNFRIVRVRGQNVYVAAGRLPFPSFGQGFSVGFVEPEVARDIEGIGGGTAMVPALTNLGLRVIGSWSRIAPSGGGLSRSTVYPDGGASSHTISYVTAPVGAPRGARPLGDGAWGAFVAFQGPGIHLLADRNRRTGLFDLVLSD